jgi:hypothetical protein
MSRACKYLLLLAGILAFATSAFPRGDDPGSLIATATRAGRVKPSTGLTVAADGTLTITGGSSDSSIAAITSGTISGATTARAVIAAEHHYYVDANRADSYTPDGGQSRPFLTIAAALTVINADATAHAAAGHYELSNYIMTVAPGTYSAALTFNNEKYLRIEGQGVSITGTIALTQTQQSGDYYSRIEFVGVEGTRAEKGPALKLAGNITMTRNNDSLTYVTFKGCWITGNILADTDGTWVLGFNGSRLAGTLSTGTFADPDSAVLVETTGWNEFAGAISNKVSFYNVDNAEFWGAIAITPIFDSRMTNCRFGSTVSIVAVKNLDLDAVSYKALQARTPTLTGITIRNLQGSMAIQDASEITVTSAITGTLSIANTIRYWNPSVGTLQALITSITDATATKQYTIMVPPGTISGASVTASSPLLLKPFVNLKGAGGRGRVTIFTGVGLSFLDAAMTTGTQRLRLEGIRFETCPLIMTAASHVMSVVIEDCPINGASSLAFTGTSYVSPSALEIRNLNIDRNTNAMYYKFAQVSFWNSTLLGLYFEDADAYFFGCDIGATANCVNTGTAGGWFEFNNCKIDQMTVGDEASESVLATFGVGGSENIQVHGKFNGYTAPASVSAFTRMRAGTLYFCTTDFKLYVKTAVVGTNTWAVVGAQ